VRDDPTVPAVVFFVFDSTPSALTIKEWSRNPRQMVACGRIRPAENTWLATTSQEILRQGFVQGVDGNRIPLGEGGIVRVVLVHHHPVSTREDGHFDPDTVMIGHSQFVDTCLTAGVDVVLFGHDHVNRHAIKPRPKGGFTHFLCCPTATEFTGPETGFFLLSFGAQGFTKEVFTWKDPTFVEAGLSKYSYS
jgi:3',5'-cyclic AMP phosphodiesterase CpdA